MGRIKSTLAKIQGEDVKKLKSFKLWPVGILAYVLILLSIWFLVIDKTKTITEIIVKATLFAFASYGTYNLTNYVFFENYGAGMVISDMLYGIFVINIVSIATFLLKTYKSN